MRFVLVSLTCAGLWAQPAGRNPFVRAVGDATVSVKPDLARVSFSVVTQAATAQDASSQNATRVSSVLSALQLLLGPNADIQTVGYTLSPNYTYPPGGGLPNLVGYTASNTVRVTTSDLANTGKIIDTGIQAGANQVSGLQFALKDEQPVRAQALKLATAQAKAHADAMAAGAGLHAGGFRSIEEGVAVLFTNRPSTWAPAAPTTPTIRGLLEV